MFRVVGDHADTVADIIPRGSPAVSVKHVRPSNPSRSVNDGMVCDQDHALAGCNKFRGMLFRKRFQRVRVARMCYKCMAFTLVQLISESQLSLITKDFARSLGLEQERSCLPLKGITPSTVMMEAMDHIHWSLRKPDR